MTALSDQSAMPQWPWWVWLLLAAILLVLFAVQDHRKHPGPKMNAPVELWPVCSTRGCRYPARVKVDSFTGRTLVCHGCADEGIAHGWFTAA